jgi:hypothetical protein
MTSLHESDKLIPALVQVSDAYVGEPRYLSGALSSRQPLLGCSAILIKIENLAARTEASHSPQGTC